MTNLPDRPTPEDIAQSLYDSEMRDSPLSVIDSETVIGLMADAVRLDRRQRLARQIATARNYLYEAGMSDYSVASIHRGERDLQRLLAVASREGWSIDDLTVWDSKHGLFRPVIS